MDTITDPGSDTRRSVRRPLWSRLGVWVLTLAGLTVALLLITSVSIFTIIGSLLLGALILRIGYFFLQQLATPPPPPPDPGELRKVRLTYRCSTCGTEVRMTAANNEDPEPPRHCMEEMELVAPLYD